jgi:hypothetical protein
VTREATTARGGSASLRSPGSLSCRWLMSFAERALLIQVGMLRRVAESTRDPPRRALGAVVVRAAVGQHAEQTSRGHRPLPPVRLPVVQSALQGVDVRARGPDHRAQVHQESFCSVMPIFGTGSKGYSKISSAKA